MTTVVVVLMLGASFIFMQVAYLTVFDPISPVNDSHTPQKCRSDLQENLSGMQSHEIVFTITNFAYEDYVVDWMLQVKTHLAKSVIVMALDTKVAAVIEATLLMYKVFIKIHD